LNADAAAATIRVGAASTTPTACGPTGCYQAQVVAAGLVSATSLAATRDRTLFFIEADRQIRVIANDSLLGDPALVAVDGSRIVGLAVDDGSDGVPSVFVSWTETTPAGRTVVNVTRYRALQNVLGQAAQILTGLPFTEGAFAPLTVSGDGLLYVALPAAEDSSALRRATTGVVMRVTRDGFTPSSVAQASPVHVAADAWPTSLSADRLKTVWSAGRAEDGTRVIAAIDATAPRVAPLSVDGLASAPLVRPALPDPVLSVKDGTNIAMAAEGQLFVGQPANGKITVENIVVNGGSRVQGIVQVPDGSLYVSVSTAERSVTVVRLRRP
jgi:glucose/arabinose dehydrogenase